MSTGDFYSASAARRSLGHFAAGKLLSAALGFGFLVLAVRSVAPDDYGGYVAVLAMCEVFYLVSGLGLSTIAQRYVPEYRLKSIAPEFRRFVAGLLRRRLLFSLGFALAVLPLWEPLMSLTGIALPAERRLLVGALLVATAGLGFLEELMGALLLQRYSQALTVARNASKIALVAALLLAGTPVTLEWLLRIEAGVATLSWLGAEWLVRRWTASAPSAAGATAAYGSTTMASVAWRFYGVQLIWTVYSPSAVKLMVTRLLGAAQTASLGFAQSITDMLRNYMPVHLLSTWLRPILVARWVAHRDLDEISLIAGIFFKLNLAGLSMAAAVFGVAGDAMMSWLTSGRYPHLGPLLLVLCVVVVAQSAHWLLLMITITLEQPGVNLAATVAAAASLPVLWLATVGFGVNGAAAGLVVAELIWVATGWVLLRRQGFRLRADAAGMLRIVLAAALAAGAAALLATAQPALPWWTVLFVVPVCHAGFLLMLRPINAAEWQLIRRFLKSGSRVPRQ